MRTLAILAALLLSACSSTTIIKSSDPHSKIYVNGEYVGTGRAVYTDHKVSFSSNEVQIVRPGCMPEYHTFRRNEQADIGAIIGGFLLTVPFLWTTEYKPYRAYDYECKPL